MSSMGIFVIMLLYSPLLRPFFKAKRCHIYGFVVIQFRVALVFWSVIQQKRQLESVGDNKQSKREEESERHYIVCDSHIHTWTQHDPRVFILLIMTHNGQPSSHMAAGNFLKNGNVFSVNSQGKIKHLKILSQVFCKNKNKIRSPFSEKYAHTHTPTTHSVTRPNTLHCPAFAT